jgi:hypothetical protein
MKFIPVTKEKGVFVVRLEETDIVPPGKLFWKFIEANPELHFLKDMSDVFMKEVRRKYCV